MPGRIARKAHQIADSGRFQTFIASVIIVNALVLGLETYEALDDDYGSLLRGLNYACLGIFVAEITIRIVAFGTRPQDFFKEGWNVFDFVVIGAVFVPGVRENATLLRVIRLLRVVRLMSVLPDLRVLMRGMIGSLPPIGSMGLLAFLFIYVYGMVGWLLFGDDLEQWSDLGDAMLTLFTILTLEGWNEELRQGMEVHEWSWAFFISFVLIASLLLINILIAIIIGAMEEARAAERDDELAQRIKDAEAAGGEYDEQVETAKRIRALKQAIADLEEQLGTDLRR